MAKNWITKSDVTALIGSGAKQNKKPTVTLAKEIDADVDWNPLIALQHVTRQHLRGVSDSDGNHFYGLYDNTSVPSTDGVASYLSLVLGTLTLTHSGDRKIFDDGGDGALSLEILGSPPALSGAGETKAYSDGVDVLVSHNGGAYAALAGGGGAGDIEGVTAGNGLSGGGTSGTVALAVDLAYAFAWTANHTWATSNTLTVGANTLVSGDKLQATQLAITSQARGDILKVNAAGTAFERMAVGAAGTVLIGGTDPSYSANPTVTSLAVSAGSAANTAIRNGIDVNTGLYFPADDQIALSTAGSARILIDASTILTSLVQTGPAGSVTSPTYSFTGDPNTGPYSIGADQYGISAGGVLRASINTTQQTFYTDILVQETGTSSDGVLTVGAATFRGRDSVGAAPGEFSIVTVYELEDSASNDQFAGSFGFEWTDATNGSEDSVATLNTSTAGVGTEVLRVSSAAVQALAAYGFMNDNDTYINNPAANEIGITLNGTERWRYGTTRTQILYGGSGINAFPLELSSNQVEGRMGCETTNSSGYAGFNFGADNRTTKQLNALMYGSGVAGEAITGVNNADLGTIYTVGATTFLVYTAGAADLVFGANGAEFARCVNGGEFKFSKMFKTVAGNEQTTVGAAGGASALPATPTKYIKFKDSAGTTLIIPAYAAA